MPIRRKLTTWAGVGDVDRHSRQEHERDGAAREDRLWLARSARGRGGREAYVYPRGGPYRVHTVGRHS